MKIKSMSELLTFVLSRRFGEFFINFDHCVLSNKGGAPFLMDFWLGDWDDAEL